MDEFDRGAADMGVSVPRLSREPLADEGEATPGPDDVNPYRERERRRELRELQMVIEDDRDDEVVPSIGGLPIW